MNSSNFPLVTIAIPTYNRPKGLRRTLGRAIEQDYPNIEILISDNASEAKEEVNGIVENAVVTDRNISFFQQDQNIGPFENFKFLFQEANGEFVMLWPDDDDYSDKSLISKLVGSFANRPCAVASMPTVEVKNAQGEVVGTHCIPEGLDIRGGMSRMFRYFIPGVTDMLFYGMFRTTLVKNFEFPSGTYCPEKFLIFHVVSSGPVLNCNAILTNIHVPKSFSEVEKMVGVSVNIVKHDILMLKFLFSCGPVGLRFINCVLYVFLQAKYSSWPARKALNLLRNRVSN